ncbi:MAG: hypothetical protein ACRDPK_18585, partial [Carbonactinosporaceae bacterium]
MPDHGSGAAPQPAADLADDQATDLAADQVLRARCAAQLLHRPDPALSPPDLVRRLLAVQAQDPAAAALALRARGRGLTA